MPKMKQDVIKQKDSQVLTKLLENLKTATSLETAMNIGKTFMDNLRGRDETPRLYYKLETCTSVAKVQALCYNTLLSGEGMGARW